jgi:phosphoribosylformylglycinamidine cyclo-ligase
VSPLDYRAAGVDIEQGDRASRLAFEHAKNTFGFRAGKSGEAVKLDGVFTGLIDAGAFYIAMNSDGVGSKSLVARQVGRLDTLGWDLLAMVADDAACGGAEPVAMVNTIDIQKVVPEEVDQLMAGLEAACQEASVSIVGGEIAELPDQIKDFSWSAALIGLLRKDRVLGPHRVQPGMTVVGLLTDNFRSNGFTLLRRVLQQQYGAEWVRKKFNTSEQTWGDIALAPSRLFSPFVVALTGGFSGEPRCDVAAVAHITGGGLEHNVGRVMPSGRKVEWSALPPPPPAMQFIIDQGWVTEAEARRAWNMGIGMAIVTSQPDHIESMAASLQLPTARLGAVI